MSDAVVSTSREGSIATILMNRPQALNALSPGVLARLSDAVQEVAQDDDVQGIIVTGAGRAFVAGADIEHLRSLDRAGGQVFAEAGQRAFDGIESLPKPVVAAVNGFALGGGCELAMACHVRVASTTARFGQPEVKLGLIPGFGGTQRLPRLIGRGLATDLTISARMIDATEALRIGLVSEVVKPDQLLARAREVLEVILANGPAAVAGSLQVIRDGMDTDQASGLALEAGHFARLCGTDEMLEGTSAFLEKREAKFR